MHTCTHSQYPRMQQSSTESKQDYQAPVKADEQNWNPNSPKNPFSTVTFPIEKVTPRQPDEHSSVSTPTQFLSPAVMTNRASISSVSDQNLSGDRKALMEIPTPNTSSLQGDMSQVSDKASECDVRSWRSVNIQGSVSSPNFAKPTASSRRRTTRVNHSPPKHKEWRPSATKPKPPNLRCTGKALTLSSIKERDPDAKSSLTESSKHSKSTRSSCRLPRPSVPKTPNVLRRKSMFTRRSPVQEESTRAFVPNPMPRYLKTGNLPEVKQTRKTLQLAAKSRMGKEPQPKPEAPKKTVPSRSLEATKAKPFALGSVMKHEEHMHQIQQRMAAEEEEDKKRRKFHPVTLRPEILQGPTFVPTGSVEPTKAKPFALGSVVKHEERMQQLQQRTAAEEEEDKKRRKFHPVTLRPEILQGPTFVPKRSEGPLTTPVDLLPYAKERSERTLAFEARQRERMEKIEHDKQIAMEEREKLEQERLRKEYESKRFKSRPVPPSHYTPDICPVGMDEKLLSDDLASERLSLIRPKSQLFTEETKTAMDGVSDSMHSAASPAPAESKAMGGILQGIRNSLSPLLRGSASLSF